MKGNELMDHVRDEMAASKHGYIEMLGEMMTAYLRRHPETEIDGKKTLSGALNHLRSAASKKQQDRCYAMPPDEGFRMMLEYYGLTYDKADYIACMLEMLGQDAPDSIDAAPKPAPEDDLFDLDALLEGGA